MSTTLVAQALGMTRIYPCQQAADIFMRQKAAPVGQTALHVPLGTSSLELSSAATPVGVMGLENRPDISGGNLRGRDTSREPCPLPRSIPPLQKLTIMVLCSLRHFSLRGDKPKGFCLWDSRSSRQFRKGHDPRQLWSR